MENRYKQYFTDVEWKTIERILEKFTVLTDMTGAVADGIVRALIIYGPPGVSKTYTVEQVLNDKTFKYIFEETPSLRFHAIHGYMRTPHLFAELWQHRNEGDILVIDDCDSALLDQDSLMLLKAALDTTDKRTITYNAQSPLLKQRKIPNTFEFNGRIIFVTNTDFKNCTTPKLKEHLSAIIDRCHYLDLAIASDEEKMLWVKYVVVSSDILQKRKIEAVSINDMLAFIETNITDIGGLSLRTVIKLAELIQVNPDTWKQTAKHTVFSN